MVYKVVRIMGWIKEKIDNFLDRRDKPFTVNDIYNDIGWEDSRKRLARYLVKHKGIRSIGKDSSRLTLYSRVDTDTSNKSNLYGRE